MYRGGVRRSPPLLLAAWASLLLAAPSGAAQPKRDACPDGFFLTDGKPCAPGCGDAAAAVISFEAGGLRVEGLCDEAVLAKV